MVATVKFADVAPANTVAVAGTVAEGSELPSVTTAPAAGAAPVSVTVAVDATPPMTAVGDTVRVFADGGLTSSVAEMLLLFKVAEMTAVACAATGDVAIANETDVAPAAAGMLAGTVAAGSELDKAMTSPPAGAGASSVIVLVATAVPPITLEAPRLSPARLPNCSDTDTTWSADTVTAGVVASGCPVRLAFTE